MPAPPKPPKREPKPRKPIKRSQLKRWKSLVSKEERGIKRVSGSRDIEGACSISRRKRPNRVRQTPRGRDKKSLQALFSQVILKRDPLCVIGECIYGRPGWICRGRNKSSEACHLLPKGAYPSIEFRTENAVGGCRRCHDWYTKRPTAWLSWSINLLGHDRLVELVDLSRQVKPETRAEIRARLEAML